VGLGRGADYGMGVDLPAYFRHANENILIAVQCENIAGVPALDEIAAVPGIDVIFVGPFDLSSSLGLPGQINAPEIQRVMKKALDVCARYGKYAGIFTFSVEQARDFAKMGFRYIIAGSDLHFLGEACTEAARRLREP
jgi:4-hydroxy-2-oxoheptanedioate aldolase